jgi:hypothetical protein
MFVSTTRILPAMAAQACLFSSPESKIPLAFGVLQEAHWPTLSKSLAD